MKKNSSRQSLGAHDLFRSKRQRERERERKREKKKIVAERRCVMSPDEESSQASKKGKGSDALCIMEIGGASSFLSELLEI